MANALNRWEQGSALPLRDAMTQLFEDSFVRPWFGLGAGSGTSHLPIDIFETGDAFVVKAWVPGVTPDKLEITTAQNRVTIRAEQPAEQQEGVRYYLKERQSGTWVRSFELPVAIDLEHIDAKLENGVLHLTLPKAPEAKPRKVEIKSA